MKLFLSSPLNEEDAKLIRRQLINTDYFLPNHKETELKSKTLLFLNRHDLFNVLVSSDFFSCKQ